MTTVNVSIPEKLKDKADAAVKAGYYASFSDLVRHAIRQAIDSQTYDLWAEQAIKEHLLGKTKSLNNAKDVDTFTNSL